jgi:5-methylthioadenosine/S-adenosylhomocysteine deaminase
LEKADLLLTNAHVLTMDSSFRQHLPGAVAVRNGAILAVGIQDDLLGTFSAGESVDCQGRILLPALVNAHTHAAMTLLRGLADDLRLDVWLLGYMMPVEREFVSPEFVRLGTKLGCAEMIRSGIGTFADMYYFEEEVAATVAEAGMRALCGQTVLKFPSPDADSYEVALDRARKFLRAWKGHRLIVPSIAPHAPYTSTEEILQACTALAREFDVPLQIHIAETAQEVENARREYAMPIIPYLRRQGVLDARLVAAHCVHIDEGEMRSLQKVGAGIAHNPSSNLKLASGIAPVERMLSAGLNVGIGTDSAASNNDLDLFEEMRLAALLAKGAGGNPLALPARTALAMATRMGACALHMGKVTGSLEPGKRADLILLDHSGLHANPEYHRDPEAVYARIVYTAKASDVDSLMVDGRWLMRGRALQTLDERQLLAESDETAGRIDTFLVRRESSVLSKLVAIETATEEEAFEVQVKVRLPEEFPILERVAHPKLEIEYTRNYQEYDTYFEFGAGEQGRLRYREDQILGLSGETLDARYRLILTGPAREREFANAVVLSRSRFLAPATHSLRFYREYFQPGREIEVVKNRLRWKIRYQETKFFINFDHVFKPPLPGRFLEVKSRTWSRRDAERKAGMIVEILGLLSAREGTEFHEDYVSLADGQSVSK